MIRRAPAILLLAMLASASAPAAAGPGHRPPEAAIQASGEIPAEEVLDVTIRLFDPGIQGIPTEELEEQGTYEELREAEAMYHPVRLMETLQATGQWGAVRVVPQGAATGDVVVWGTILESNGKDLHLRIAAKDSGEKPWFDRDYKEKAPPGAYDEKKDEIAGDPFQNLYNRVANDLLKARRKLKPAKLRALPVLSRLRFAADLAPATYGDYLEADRRGRLSVQRLPADGDPMMDRVLTIRDREALLVDTLTDHYAGFYFQMLASYGSWRALSYQEQVALQELRRKSRNLKILGVLSILGGVWAAKEGEGGGGVTDLAILGGIAAIRAGMGKSQEAQIHREAIKELAASLDAELDPLVVEVEGRALRLTGSAETQYATWRELLHQIFITETGLPVDPDTTAEVTGAGGEEFGRDDNLP